MKHSVNRGQRNHGRVNVHDSRGRFTSKPSLGAEVCVNCNAFILPEVKPERVNGFIDPASMKPRFPETCHRCGKDWRAKDDSEHELQATLTADWEQSLEKSEARHYADYEAQIERDEYLRTLFDLWE